MEKPIHVQVDEEAIRKMASEIKGLPPRELFGLPVLPTRTLSESETVLYDLMSGAVNYCFWYGLPYIRPNGASALRMYELLDEAFEAYLSGRQPELPGQANLSSKGRLLRHFISLLAENQFPLMAERTRHILELEPSVDVLPEIILSVVQGQKGCLSFPELFRTLLRLAPGFAEDPFFKRALLFFMQLNRQMGWLQEEVEHLPIPADYQVPRVLRDRGVLIYSEALAAKVHRFELIPPGSAEECEIRAASIVACDLLANESGSNPGDVDYYCWTIRNSCKGQFHLTSTPNY
jgi:hypothetical protein